MPNNVVLTPDQAQGLTNYVGLTTLITKKAVAAEKELAKTASDREPITKAAEELPQIMVDLKEIDEIQVEKMAELLGSHAGALSVVKNAMTRISEMQELVKEANAKAAALGAAVPQEYGHKSGAGEAHDSLNSPFVGQKTAERKQSDIVLLERLGIRDKLPA
jgi:hypothetical protein